MLGHRSTYKKLEVTPFLSLVGTLNTKLKLGLEAGLLSKKEYNYLKVENYTIPTFYIIPKLHKSLSQPPRRPIVSAINGPLENVRKYVDSLIKDMVNRLPSFVRDTRDVLLKLLNLTLPEDVLLVGIDVKSLYTSIPHQRGIAAVVHFLEQDNSLIGAQNEFVAELLEFMLNNNFFQFLGLYYHQQRGTCMGAPWTPSYACLHLGLWEEEVVFKSSMYLGHCRLWLRYIDDVLIIWRGTVEEIMDFLSQLNINDRNIKLTY